MDPIELDPERIEGAGRTVPMGAMGTACQRGAREFPGQETAGLSDGPMYLMARSALCSGVGHALIVGGG